MAPEGRKSVSAAIGGVRYARQHLCGLLSFGVDRRKNLDRSVRATGGTVDVIRSRFLEVFDAYLGEISEIGEMAAAAKMTILKQVALDFRSLSLRNLPVRLFAFATLLVLLTAGCASRPPSPVDPVAPLLVPGEPIQLRVPADLMHGHDMEEPPYGDQGYAPIPTYPGELLLTDRRILFVVRSTAPEASWVSIPYGAIARARPSRTPLLNYIVVWDPEGHADSFVVDARFVQALHRKVGEALMARGRLPQPPTVFGHFSP